MVETNQNEYRKIDKMFHQIIYNSVSGFWLTDIIENLNAIADIRTNRLYVSFQEHQDIYNKLLERDFDGMKIKMQKHLESFKIRAQNAFQSNL